MSLCAKVVDRHEGKLPSAGEFLRNIIEQDFSISKKVSTKWVLAVKDAWLDDRGREDA
jgi:hypothetical protein